MYSVSFVSNATPRENHFILCVNILNRSWSNEMIFARSQANNADTLTSYPRTSGSFEIRNAGTDDHFLLNDRVHHDSIDVAARQNLHHSMMPVSDGEAQIQIF